MYLALFVGIIVFYGRLLLPLLGSIGGVMGIIDDAGLTSEQNSKKSAGLPITIDRNIGIKVPEYVPIVVKPIIRGADIDREINDPSQLPLQKKEIIALEGQGSATTVDLKQEKLVVTAEAKQLVLQSTPTTGINPYNVPQNTPANRPGDLEKILRECRIDGNWLKIKCEMGGGEFRIDGIIAVCEGFWVPLPWKEVCK